MAELDVDHASNHNRRRSNRSRTIAFLDPPSGHTVVGMTTMTDTEWRSFVTAGTKLAHAALTQADGRPHVTPICFILDGDELAFALSPGSVKGKLLARDQRIALCISDERQPYGFVTIEGNARTSADPARIEHVAKGIAERYYPTHPADALAETFVEQGFTAVHVTITKVIAHAGLG
jgi:PPOX class probable F420-dependent enzyme